MYLKLEEDLKTKIEKITGNDYDFKGNFLPGESVTAVFEDLICEIDRLEERLKDIEQDRDDNYKPYTKEELYGVNDRNFI